MDEGDWQNTVGLETSGLVWFGFYMYGMFFCIGFLLSLLVLTYLLQLTCVLDCMENTKHKTYNVQWHVNMKEYWKKVDTNKNKKHKRNEPLNCFHVHLCGFSFQHSKCTYKKDSLLQSRFRFSTMDQVWKE